MLLMNMSTLFLSTIQGTAVITIWLRLLGARVGSGVYFDTMPPTETDCIELRDGAILLEAPQTLVPHTLDRGMLQFAPIRIGQNASVSMNSCIMLMCTVG